MAGTPVKLNLEELFPRKTDTRTPDVEIVTTFAAGCVDVPGVSHFAGLSWSSQKKQFADLYSCGDESSTPEVEIVACRATGSVNVPQGCTAVLSDHSLNEKFDRTLKGSMHDPREMKDKFISHLQLYQNDFYLNSISSTPNHLQLYQTELPWISISSAPKDVGGCMISRKSNSTESGANSSKADAALWEKLKLISASNESLQRYEVQMHRKVQQLHMHPQADEVSSINKFSRCFAEIHEQTPPSTSWRGGQPSGLRPPPQRKSARLLSKRRKACKDWDLLDWEFEEVVEDVVLLDDDDLCGETMDDSCDECTEVRLYYPSRNDPESVVLTYSDLECLNPEQFLSSPIMNFYIQYLQRTEPTTGRPHGEYHIFNTFFYGKLEKALSQKGDRSQNFMKLRRWWKGVNIFSKAYILLPIHGSSHWSLAIICNPGKDDDSGVLILHLDSLGLHSSQQISGIISIFLNEEWNYMNQNPTPDFPCRGYIWQYLPLRIDKNRVVVPQQKNEYDCGIFVLYFIMRFLQEAPQRLRKHDLSMFHAKWFRPAEASSLRKTVRDLLIEEFTKSNH